MKKNNLADLFLVKVLWLPLSLYKKTNDASEVFAVSAVIDYRESLVSRIRHLRTIAALVGVVFVVFSLRIFFTQIVHGKTYALMAQANKTRTVYTPANRGAILDRNGIVLAKNVPAFRLLVTAKDLPRDQAQKDDLLLRVSELFVLPAEDMVNTIRNLPEEMSDSPVLVADHVSYETAMRFYGLSDFFPGFSLELGQERAYLTAGLESLSHVLGFTGILTEKEYTANKEKGYRAFDSIGKQGIESTYEGVLRGTLGKDIYEVNAQGKVLRLVSHRAAVSGDDVRLALDARLQAYIEETLAGRLKNAPTQRAAVVVTNPQNGDVLALVSYPGFDANAFIGGISSEQYQKYLQDENAPLFPRAIAGEYPSGSVIKPLFAAAALTENIITPQTSFVSVGGLTLGDRFFPDWRPGGHGTTNVYHAIADSVNTFFYIIGGGTDTFHGMGIDTLMQWARRFGLGEETGVDIPGEADGFLPSPDWKKAVKGEDWYLGDTYNVSIGQGDLLVTPLQINRMTAAIGNGGMLRVPGILLDRTIDKGERVVDQDVADIVRDAMRETVTNGTARIMQDVNVPVAGKTGTAQWSRERHPHSWFTGFAPFESPSIAITVLVEQGGDLNIATPIAHDILLWYFQQEEN